jgi:hypothetical protein
MSAANTITSDAKELLALLAGGALTIPDIMEPTA